MASRKRIRTSQVWDGRPIAHKFGKPFYLSCCYCGSVDKVVITRDGDRAVLTFWHDERETAREKRALGL
jgi:hypothetical protein